ncbi:TPA: hypothetical protein DCX16_00685 [bacterium]|nr:hypothetical protein [bacterium]
MVWDSIIGQDEAISLLKTLAKEKNFDKPLLFLGKDGSGKRFAAKVFACAINCENLGCNACHSCKMFNKGIHPDIKEVKDDNGYIKIDMIRDIIKEAYLRPMYKKKIYIIDNCHFLTEEAENSLLKILEEAKETIFILITTTTLSLFPTILSRCFTVRFKSLSLDSQRKIFEANGHEFHEDIAELSFGSISLALEYGKYDIQSIISWLDLFKKEKNLNVANRLIEMENRFPFLLDIFISILRKKASFSFIEKLLSAKEYINANCNKRLVLERMVLDA